MTNAKHTCAAPSAHRARARAALRGNWAHAIFVALAVNFLGPSGFSIAVNHDHRFPLWIYPPENVIDLLYYSLRLPFSVLLTTGALMLAGGLIVGGALELGSARYDLNLLDGRNARFGDLLRGFSRFRSAMVMNIPRYLVRLLLTLLGPVLLLPGAFLLSGWALAPYIMAEDPACSGPDALKRSWQLMRGHKLAYCKLELSFLLWYLLTFFSFGIGKPLLDPYTAAARASFYRELTGTQ